MCGGGGGQSASQKRLLKLQEEQLVQAERDAAEQRQLREAAAQVEREKAKAEETRRAGAVARGKVGIRALIGGPAGGGGYLLDSRGLLQ